MHLDTNLLNLSHRAPAGRALGLALVIAVPMLSEDGRGAPTFLLTTLFRQFHPNL